MYPVATEDAPPAATPATDGAAHEALPAPAPPRVIIEGVEPAIDAGRFPVNRTVGQEVIVGADVFADGHDLLAAVVRYRHLPAEDWVEAPMTDLGNDRWSARFLVTELGWYEYMVLAWVDRFASWRRDLSKKTAAGQDVASDLLEGAELIGRTAHRLSGPDDDKPDVANHPENVVARDGRVRAMDQDTAGRCVHRNVADSRLNREMLLDVLKAVTLLRKDSEAYPPGKDADNLSRQRALAHDAASLSFKLCLL